MKKTRIMAVILAFSLALAGCQSGGETKKDTAAKTDATGIRANKGKYITVGDKEVSYEEFYKFYDLYANVMAMQGNLSRELTSLFARDKIVSDDNAKNGIKITDQDIDKEIELYVQNLGGKEQFDEYFDTLGTDMETFRKNIENSVANQKHMEKYLAENKPSDDEIKKYYEENKAQLDSVNAKHILVKDEKTAKEVSDKIKNGEDFKKMSDQYSIDEAAKANGGELGVVSANGFDPDFVKAAFALKDNETSEPVKTQFGYHIINVTKNNVGLEANKENIIQSLGQEKYNKDMSEKIKALEIKYFDKNGKELKSEETTQENVGENK